MPTAGATRARADVRCETCSTAELHESIEGMVQSARMGTIAMDGAHCAPSSGATTVLVKTTEANAPADARVMPRLRMRAARRFDSSRWPLPRSLISLRRTLAFEAAMASPKLLARAAAIENIPRFDAPESEPMRTLSDWPCPHANPEYAAMPPNRREIPLLERRSGDDSTSRFALFRHQIANVISMAKRPKEQPSGDRK